MHDTQTRISDRKSEQMILVAGPYRSGTKDDPALMAKNLSRLEEAALGVYQKGHIPLIGEWVALPLIKKAGGQTVGDEIFQQYAYPVAHRLLDHCQAVLRLPGHSQGADQDVMIALARGLRVYHSLEEIPEALPGGAES